MLKTLNNYSANVIGPDGNKDFYSVCAATKTEARKKIGDKYRLDYPSNAGIFYSFAKCRLEWLSED